MAGAACGERPHVRRLRPMPCTLQPRPRPLGALTWLFKGKESPPERNRAPCSVSSCPHGTIQLHRLLEWERHCRTGRCQHRLQSCHLRAARGPPA